MDNFFKIPVTYKSVEYSFYAQLIAFAYSYRIDVEVFENIISFERDDEQNFRALLLPDGAGETPMMDKALLEEIARQLTTLFED